MAIQEPSGEHGLWPAVKSRTGWPDTDEDRVAELSRAWLNGAGVVGRASRVGRDVPAVESGWRDEAGATMAARLRGNVDFATKTVAPEMYRLGGITKEFADDIRSAKDYIHRIIDANLWPYRLAGALPWPYQGMARTLIVNKVASAINDMLGHIENESKYGGGTRQGVGNPPFLGPNWDNDWAGREILSRYLLGGDDRTIVDDPRWTEYMTGNQRLREQLLGPTLTAARDALDGFRAGEGANGEFSQQFHATIENGEGMVGYEYLHGTDADAGDFRFDGNTTVTARPDGNYEVTIDGDYTWHDKIDPNPRYSTDVEKSSRAETMSGGLADPYNLSVKWGAKTTVVLDQNGNVVSMKGYPS
ncbi:hypothetical protein ACQPZF_28265 [Actinosynnema sp. CS-041913]|uniref:WXG100-like domain-containing protein n=1 Tax=Actinosynnema sp. CS-041913 TaxID=3239917 RepID=UPI003D8DA55F